MKCSKLSHSRRRRERPSPVQSDYRSIVAHVDVQLGQKATVLKLEEHISGVAAGIYEGEFTEITVSCSDPLKPEVERRNVLEDKVVEPVVDVCRFILDLTVDQQDRQNGFWQRQILLDSGKTVPTS